MIKKLLFLLLLIPILSTSQHLIKGKFEPKEKFTFAILYRVSPTTSVYVGNSEVKKEDGNFEFKLDSAAVAGTYRIVYGLPQESNNFDLLYNAKEDVDVDFNLETGVKFNKSVENKLLNSYKSAMNFLAQKIQAHYTSGGSDKKQFDTIISDLKGLQKQFEEAGEGTLALEFIKASRPYIPDTYVDPKTFSENVKKNYFTGFSFDNKVLQSSNFLIEATMNYVFNFIDRNKPNASYKENVDTVMKKIGDNNPAIKKVILDILWNQFNGGGNEELVNYVGQTYLLPIVKAKNDQKSVDRIINYKKSSYGEIAPDFTVEIPNKKGKIQLKKMRDLDSSENYLIAFWSTTCSHCLEELPLLKDYIKTIDKKKLTVIAIGLEEQIYRWKEMTTDYPDFIHVFGEGKWENPIGDAYNVTGTPTFFFLDKDKKIIGKPKDFYEFKNYYDIEYKKITPKTKAAAPPHKHTKGDGHNH